MASHGRPTRNSKGKSPLATGSSSAGPTQPSPPSEGASSTSAHDQYVQQQIDLLSTQNEQLSAQLNIQNEQLNQIIQQLSSNQPSSSNTLKIPDDTTPASSPTPIPTSIPTPASIQAPVLALPAVPTITKLKGRENYKTWAQSITLNARTYRVYEALSNPSPETLNEQQKNFAFLLITTNVSPSIQSSIADCTTAYEAWENISNKYQTQNFAEIVRKVQELYHIHYGKFKSSKDYQKTFLSIVRSIRNYSASASAAFYSILTAHALNGIGRANNMAKAHIEDGINMRTFDKTGGHTRVRIPATRLLPITEQSKQQQQPPESWHQLRQLQTMHNMQQATWTHMLCGTPRKSSETEAGILPKAQGTAATSQRSTKRPRDTTSHIYFKRYNPRQRYVPRQVLMCI